MGPKRVNNVAKGARAEARAVELLQQQGYTTHRAVRSSQRRGNRFISNTNDVFGSVDIVAKREGSRTRWVQVTTGTDIGRKKAKLASTPWTLNHDRVEIWRWVGGDGKRIDARTGRPRPRMYFQVYSLDHDFVYDSASRISAAGDNGSGYQTDGTS